MSDKYIAKKYVAVADMTNKSIKCPNCHQPMNIAGKIFYCQRNPKCKLQDVPYREVKSLTTIQRVDTFRGIEG